MKTKVMQIVKTRLGFDDTKDDLINSYIEEIGERIKHYCNIRAIPKALNHTWASMVIDALRVEQSSLDEIEEVSGENIKIGDTSVSPAAVQGVIATSKSVI